VNGSQADNLGYTCKPAALAAGREKKFGLAAVDFAKQPAAGEKKQFG